MAKKKESLSFEERLEKALVPDWEQPYKVPRNWVWTRVNTVCGLQNGEKYKGELLPYLEAKYLRGKIEATIKDSGNFIAKGAKVILVDGENSGEVFHINENGYMGSTFKQLNIADNLNNNLFEYFISIYKDDFRNSKTGSAIPHLNKDLFYNLSFPLPPFAEQQRIVDRIESLFSKLDEVKEKAQIALDSFENRKASILYKAFTGELTKKWREENGQIENHYLESVQEYLNSLDKKNRIKMQEQVEKIIPYKIEGWLKCSVGAIGVVSNGSTPSRKIDEYWNGTINWVSSGEVKNNILTSTRESITKEGFNNSSVNMLPVGTVLIAMIGEGKTRGQSAILNIEATINQNIAAIIVNKNYVSPEFLWYCFQKNYTANREKGNGSGPQALNCQRVRELDFILPTLPEQIEIVRILDSIFEKETQAKELANVIEKIELMKKAILARVFRGELGTNNPEEEGALELLKEILNKQVESPKEKKYVAKRISVPKEIENIFKTNLEREIYKTILKNSVATMDDFFAITKKFPEIIEALNFLKVQGIIDEKEGSYRLK